MMTTTEPTPEPASAPPVDAVHGAEIAYSPLTIDGWAWSAPTHGEHFRRCTWCGSIHPDDLVATPAWLPHWADRKYGWPHKFYVDLPNDTPDELFVLGASTTAAAPGGGGWVRTDDLTPDLRAVAERDGYLEDGHWRPDWLMFGPRRVFHAKFYTRHLADPALSGATRAAIEARGGLAFSFTGDVVSWRPAVQG
jgi:hypothetical protein